MSTETENSLQMSGGIQMSEQIGELAKALSAAKFGKVKKDAENPFFKSKYAPLENVIEATRSGLAEQGLSIVQLVNGEHLDTVLMHESGQWISSNTRLLMDKAGAQGQGSAITYARRYALSAMLNVASEFDDDGHYAQNQKTPKRESAKDVEKQYEELTVKASDETLTNEEQKDKWGKIGIWLVKKKVSKKLMDRYNSEKNFFDQAIEEDENFERSMENGN